MKLKKKITALCAAILLLVAASLCAAMLWQVREQSYGALLQRSLDSLDELAVSFATAVYQTSYEMGSALSWRVFLTHCFRSCGTAGSALYVNGECLFAATPVDPESYLTVSSVSAAASTRVRAYGRNYLVLGKAVYKKHAGLPPADPKHPVDHIEIPVAPQSPLEMPDVPGDVPLHRHIPLLHPFFD